ncbi:trihydroxytoluene oxygenase [Polychaeton citri CBS 116435]|uniref:Trihydroxytoluene oxygenase n=1 Tax=Polychaeton citri CBS 116435 TaxID=1314669 RepID=A0A9P4UT77_9PEZI|nr:trihydroxytoluene oxygenase [Polychaeton citri CBS 116435]
MVEVHTPNGHASQHGEGRPVTITAASGDSAAVKPNTGATVSDVQAIGDESESLQSWRKRLGKDTSRLVKLVKVVHMRYQHPDLGKITTFLQDFGMNVVKRTGDKVWFGGYGPDQYVYYAQTGEKKFLGGTFEVESMEELKQAAKIPGATEIEELVDAPGGGYLLTAYDPEGFPINLIYGQQAAERQELPQNVIYNSESEKPRVRQFNRFTPGPAAVHKLGHYGMCTQKFDVLLDWYISNFNFAPSDLLYVPSEGGSGGGPNGRGKRDVAAFLHIDRGSNPVDHHTLFLSQNPTSHVHHASFEVHDFDTQHLGHQWLASKGYDSVWGVGRHVLGSQIFDYWWDVHGNMIEHYADGDLVNQDTPVGWGAAGDESLAVWGPEVPKWFLD